jgi:sodium/bile acid cotransporter 7
MNHLADPPSQVAGVSPETLVVKLMLTVLVPTVVGMALRQSSKRVAAWVTAHRTALSIFSSCNLVCIIWQTLSGAR